MATYYVDPLNGSDSNNGSSIALAFRSTAKCETVVAAGDTVKLLATKTEFLTSANTITLSASGGVQSPIYWVGCDPSGNALPDGSYYTIDGSGMTIGKDILNTGSQTYRMFRNVLFANSMRFAISCSNDPSSTIQFDLCSITNPKSAGFGVNAGSNGIGYLATNCVLTGSGASGSQKLTSGNTNRNDVTLQGCVVSGFNVVFTQSGTNGSNPVYGNVFANNGTVSPGTLYNGGQWFVNNVFYNNSLCVGISDRTITGGVRGCFVVSNTFVNCGTAISGVDSTSLTYMNVYNHYYNNNANYAGGSITQGSHEIGGDPLFNSPGTLDFRLKSGSPLIGAGPRGANIAGLAQIGGGSSNVPIIGEGLVF